MRFLLPVTLSSTSFLVKHAVAHVYLTSPPARNYEANLAGNEYCPHCLNGGTTSQVQDYQISNYGDGIFLWPPGDDEYENSRHGICGDPAEADGTTSADGRYGQLGTISADKVYKAGDVIPIGITIRAHHKGHMELRLCDVSESCELTYECLKEHVLVRAGFDHLMAGASGYIFPADPKDEPTTCTAGTDLDADGIPIDLCFPERVFLGNRNSPNVGITKQGSNWYLSFKAKLPDGFTCNHCVLHLTYLSSNRCSPIGYRSDIESFTDTSVATCGLDTTYPEEFWNCADIAIVDNPNVPLTDSCAAYDYSASSGGGDGGGGGSCCSDCSTCPYKSACEACSGCTYSNKDKTCS